MKTENTNVVPLESKRDKGECSVTFCWNWLEELEELSETKQFENPFKGRQPDSVTTVQINILKLSIFRMISSGFPQDEVKNICMREIIQSVKEIKEWSEE
tara:strand:+ start:155 stop:454 length:300 start_codon:yes stop_codon:yes gene_type:complete